MKYHDNQRRAIEHFNGPALVLSGPGSGKTAVIVERIRTLIEKRNVNPEQILVVTFTKAAAKEMEMRFQNGMNGGRGKMVTFGTFHSVFWGILKETSGFRGKEIITEKEKSYLLKQCLLSNEMQTSVDEEFITNLLGEIARVKGNSEGIENAGKSEEFKRIFKQYQRALQLENRMDFEDILQETYHLLYSKKEVRSTWQQRFSYILVDEFQDINEIQYRTVQLLAQPENNLFVVGDEDQAIYGFRGARPEMIFRFQQDYENHQLIQLNVNYRCTETIVEAAGKLISHNTLRTDKELQADKKGGKNLSIRQFKNQGEELISLTAEIRRKLKQGYEKDEIAILVRNNSQIPVIMKVLQNNGIGGCAKKQSKGLHKGMVFQDISAYLMASEDYPEKELMENRGLLKIMNKPRRFLPREMVLQKGMTWERLKEQLRNCPEIMEQIENLEFGLGMIKKLPAYAAINFIRKGMKYDEYLLEYAKEHQCNKKELFRQLEEIQNNAYSVKTVWEWLERRKEEGDEPGEHKGIQLMTMHGAKGLEFPVVFLPDCNQGIIPTKTSLLEGRIEEERRVFYVAMTRAEKELYIWGVKEQLGTPVEMSIFVDEILCK